MYMAEFPMAFHLLNFVVINPAVNFTCSDSENQCASNCTSHVFNRSVFKETIATQWDLVCKKEPLANFVQTVTMLGTLFGGVLFGYVSDRFGRRKPLIAAAIIQAILGSAAPFIPWFWVYLGVRFLISMVTGGILNTTFVLLMEVTGQKIRTTVGALYQVPYALGFMTLAGVAYFIRDWRYLLLALSLPGLFLGIFYWIIIPESPRWLASVGKIETAIKATEKAARINKMPTENIRPEMLAYFEKNKTAVPQTGGNVFDLFKTKNLRTWTCCLCFIWVSCGLGFYGVAQFIGRLQGNMFINLMITSGVQVLGIIISVFAMNHLGRKYSLICVNLISGIPMLCIPFVGSGPWVKPSLAIVSMFGLEGAFTVVFVYCSEVFPTIVRNVGMGFASMCARIGGLIAPFSATLAIHTYEWIPPIIFGSVPLIGAFLCIWTPETLNCKLPDTIEEAEAYRPKMKFKERSET